MASEVTQLLNAMDDGTPPADQLLPLVYEELRNLAAAKMAQEKPARPCRPPRRCMRLGSSWPGRATRSLEKPGDFFGTAAEALRRFLVDPARHPGIHPPD